MGELSARRRLIRAVLDTHSYFWYMFGDARLSERVRSLVDSGVAQGDQVAVSSITLVEMTYLEEKQRIPDGRGRATLALLEDPAGFLTEVPVDHRVAAELVRIPRAVVPDMPDRIIAATALMLGVPLATRDARIRRSAVETIW